MFSIFINLLVLFLGANTQQCQFPNQRCICITSSPMCRCTSITSDSTLNFALSYKSHLVLQQGLGCLPCPSSCLQCSSINTCTSCQDEFTLTNSTCLPCPTNCRKCVYRSTNSNYIIPQCTQCILGYFLDSRFQCQFCPLEGSLQCTSDTLISCLSSYWLDNNGATCVKCDNYCKICSSTTKCSTCIDGYYVSQYRCLKCLPQCLLCSSSTTCSKCLLPGYYFDIASSQCTRCGLNCVECSNLTTCLACDNKISATQIIQSNGTCSAFLTPPDINCLNYKSLNSQLICSKCKFDYFQQFGSNKCFYGCSILCRQCQGAHFGLCSSCNDNSFLYNRHCLPKNNINNGTGFQIYVSSMGSTTYFGNNNQVRWITRLANPCLKESVVTSSVSPYSLTLNFNNLQAYRLQLSWKVYITVPSANSTLFYSLKFVSSSSIDSREYQVKGQQTYSCSSKMSDNGCTNICISKQKFSISGSVKQFNQIVLSAAEDSILGLAEMLVVGFRCGGVQGAECLECNQINVCTKCVNPAYYILAESCIQECPPTYYIHQQSRKCHKICPPGTYPTPTPLICQPCPSQCLTCNSPQSCLSCTTSYYLFEPTQKCLPSCPARYFPNQYFRKCQKCSSPCLQCLSNRQCTSCMYGFYQNGACGMSCMPGYFGSLVNRVCQKCDDICLTCQFEAITCIDCSNGYILMNSKCINECPVGFYKKDRECVQCMAYCSSCLNQTYCLKCSVGFLYQNSCLASCLAPLYPNIINKQCSLCPPKCSKCQNLTYCTQCISPALLDPKLHTCLQSCPYLHYPYAQFIIASVSVSISNYTYICKPCQQPCFQCLNESYCLSCIGLFYFNGLCLQKCPEGTYEDGSTLSCSSSCPVGCSSCSFYNKCTKCEQGFILFDSQCITECPTHYYRDTTINTCSQCPYSCLTCISETQCLTCLPTLHLTPSSSCLPACPPTTFASLLPLSICLPCQFPCSQCQLNVNVSPASQYCTVCTLGYYLNKNNGSCNLSCPDQMFGVAGICYQCYAPCINCVSEGQCLSCMPGYGLLLDGGCVVECPIGFYPHSKPQIGLICQHCSAGCVRCLSDTQCLQCQFSLYFHYQTSSCLNISACMALNSFYPNSQQFQCSACPSQCLTCQSSQICSRCIQNMYLHINTQNNKSECIDVCPAGYYPVQSNQTCLSCSGEYCSKCRIDGVCIQCYNGNLFAYNQSHVQCLKICPNGYYSNGGSCMKCKYPCLFCNSFTQCTKCHPSYILFPFNLSSSLTQNCMLSCPNGYFKSTQINQSIISQPICLSCPANCLQCQSDTQCNVCNRTHVLVDGKCSLNCPSATFQFYGTCFNCMYGCSKCFGSNTCETCIIGFLYNGQCVKNCPYGFIPLTINGSQNCISCAASCLTCSISASICTSCLSPLFLYLQNCIAQCPSGSYPSLQIRQCLTCTKPCQTCSNSYSCETCIYGYILYKQKERNQCVEGPLCPNSYFLDLQENYCKVQCSASKLQFSEPISRTCSKICPSSLVSYKQNMTCLQSCPEGQKDSGVLMWINERIECTIGRQKLSEDFIKQFLPYVQCTGVEQRGYLVVLCTFSVDMNFQGGLGQITVDEMNVIAIRIGSNNKLVKIYIQPKANQTKYTNKWLNIKFNERYKIKSKTFPILSSTQISRNLQQSKTYPLQNPSPSFLITSHHFYTNQHHQTSLYLHQLSASVAIASVIIWVFSFIKHKKSNSVVWVIGLQWLYLSSLIQTKGMSVQVKGLLSGFAYSFGIRGWNNNQQGTQSKLYVVNQEERLWGSQWIRYQLWNPVDLMDYRSLSIPIIGILCGFLGLAAILFVLRFLCNNFAKAYDYYKQKHEQQQKSQTNENSSNEESDKKQSQKQKQKENENQKVPQQNTNTNQKSSSNSTPSIDPIKKRAVTIKQQSNPFPSISSKLSVLLHRFTSTYPQHILLLISTPCSLLFCTQLHSPQLLGLIISCLLTLLLFVNLLYNIKYLYTNSASLSYFIKQSYKYYIYCSISGWAIGAVVIVSDPNMFFGVSLGFAVVEIYLACGLWRPADWRMAGWTGLSVLRIFTIGAFVACEAIVSIVDRDKLFLINWAPTLLIILYVIALAICAARDFFQQESIAFKDLLQKTQKALLSPSASPKLTIKSMQPFLYTGTSIDILKYESEESFFEDQDQVQHTDDEYDESYTHNGKSSQSYVQSNENKGQNQSHIGNFGKRKSSGTNQIAQTLIRMRKDN